MCFDSSLVIGVLVDLLKYFKLLLIDYRSILKYFYLVILHYQVNLQSEFLHRIRENVIKAVNSILRREFEV